jgi:hypothetical protein
VRAGRSQRARGFHGSNPREQQALGAAALGQRPAAHKERLAAAVLVLDPGAATHAGQIVAAESFGDDALQTMVPRRCQHPLGVADEVPRRPPADAVIEPEFEQQLAPALVGKLARRAAIEMEQIEREIGDWPALSVPAGLVGRGAQPPPQACEVGAAVGCQADELAVE